MFDNLDMEEEIRKEVQTWYNYSDEQFVDRVRSLRNGKPGWWDSSDFRYHLDLELRMRLLLQ